MYMYCSCIDLRDYLSAFGTAHTKLCSITDMVQCGSSVDRMYLLLLTKFDIHDYSISSFFHVFSALCL